jgi:hypothetical protein
MAETFASFYIYYREPLKKRCRILPAGGTGGVPQLLKNSPKNGGYRGLISFNQSFFSYMITER